MENINGLKNFYSRLNFSVLKALIIILIVISLGIYIGNILFGKNSIEVLNALEYDKSRLQEVIIKLKNDNAALQKEYFELRQLDPDMKDI